jgi:hypothetical protein
VEEADEETYRSRYSHFDNLGYARVFAKRGETELVPERERRRKSKPHLQCVPRVDLRRPLFAAQFSPGNDNELSRHRYRSGSRLLLRSDRSAFGVGKPSIESNGCSRAGALEPLSELRA